jgi:Calcium-dependent channel, 7TM region, putative phosphate
VRFWLVWAGFTAMALLFMIPVGAVQALLTISNLSKIPGITQAMSLPVVPSIISGILPTLALTIFLL